MSTSHGSPSTRDATTELKTSDTYHPSDARRLDQKDTSRALLEYTVYLGRCIAGANGKPTNTSGPGSKRK
ncbi:hypothetical protein A1O7_06402 [Cladophialophora yegresii CBS 114405]|uniref:Uncharacterized protein n=1 Tax=Cladophialophora yegresii CBS 114405 TaxID=1182544 RepID=W9W355_9EURO|nr:uncharacterized protein A1O7_06402 [Cladophialophora yegresii CBS 114405]EXJ58971.1 hypothetical protein A1O7_06402 [Cladophialophora yegresii CBS 114405]